MKELEVFRNPHDVYVILTSKCNLRCLHCYGTFGEPHIKYNEMSGDEWNRIFSELADLDVFYVNIAGGEPTIHPHFPEIIGHLRDIGLHFILTTNGLLSPRASKALIDANEYAIGVKVSLDGPTAESHALLRVGPDFRGRRQYFDKTVETIEELIAGDVPVTIATCLHKDNIALVPEFLELVLRLRPVSWFISTISPNGRAKDFFQEIYASDSYYPHEYWAELKEECKRNRILVRFIDMATAANYKDVVSAFGCPAASSFCEINSDGLVSPCPLSRVNITEKYVKWPNAREASIADIWQSPAFQQFRSWRTRGCDGCSAFGGCGRCVAQSMEWFDGDPYQPTPFCIEKGEILGLDNLPALRDQVARKQAHYAASAQLKPLPMMQAGGRS